MFFEFIAHEWELVSILLVLVILFFLSESRRSGKTVTPALLGQMVNQQGAVLVDVREATEFRAGHISGSLNIPYAKFAERVSELEKHKDKPVIMVCKMGQTAGSAAKLLNKEGFAQVYRLSGGLLEWQNQQLPLVKS